MTNCYIYQLLDNENTPFYVGVTKNIEARFYSHLHEAKLFIRVGEKNWVNDKIRKIAGMLANGQTPTISTLEICDISIGDERETFHYTELSKSYTLLQIPVDRRCRYTHAYKYK